VNRLLLLVNVWFSLWCILLSKAAQTFIARGRWFYPCTPVSSTKKAGRHYKTEILLKVALNSITKAKTRHSLRAVGDSLKEYNPHPHFTYLFSFFFFYLINACIYICSLSVMLFVRAMLSMILERISYKL
jgi:hypothetical protein